MLFAELRPVFLGATRKGCLNLILVLVLPNPHVVAIARTLALEFSGTDVECLPGEGASDGVAKYWCNLLWKNH